MNNYVIYPILQSINPHTHKSLMTYLLYTNGKEIELPALAWYINANGTHVLVDTGITAADQERLFGAAGHIHVQTLEEGLAKHGITPEDIDIVILTHLHHDHCANAKLCKNAKFVVQKAELEFAYSHPPVFHYLYHQALFDGLNYQVVEGRAEILPGIEVIPMSGHTPGCQAVAIQTAKGIVAISGACSIKDNFFPRPQLTANWPVIIPTFHVDPIKSFYEMIYLKSCADIVIPQHEIEYARMEQIPPKED